MVFCNITDLILMSEQSFFIKVYDVVRKIPYGKVTTYGAIARFIGSPQSARMVGWAMNNSHTQQEYVPAHRVINRNGVLTGKHHFPGENLMQEFLESEGHVIVQDTVQEFCEKFWDPAKHSMPIYND